MPTEAYRLYRDAFRTGDLLQWRTNSLLGAAIRWKTGADVNHSSLVVRLKEYEGLERRVFTVESMEGAGVQLQLVSRRLENYDGSVWWYPLRKEFNHLRQAIGEYAFERSGIPYDYMSLVTQLIKRSVVCEEALFCSEYCYWAYGKSGCLPIGWEVENAPYPGEMPDLKIFDEPVLMVK